MNPESDARRFSQALTVLEKYFEKALDESLKLVYFQSFADLTIEEFEGITRLAMAKLKWFPKIIELRELAEGSPDDRAATAWEVAMGAYRKAGYFYSVMFEDGAIGAALITVFGGWKEFCEAMHPVYGEAESSWQDRQAAIKERRISEGRRIQIGGLSDEMVASKRKEFLVAYRNAVRMTKLSPYLPGHFEIENRNTVGSWNRGEFQIEGGREVYKQRIYIAGHRGGHFIEASFERLTGLLIGGEGHLLERAPVANIALPPASPRALLASGSAPMPPDETQEYWSGVIAEVAGRFAMPGQNRKPLDGEELEKRMRELKQQAERLRAEEEAIEVEAL